MRELPKSIHDKAGLDPAAKHETNGGPREIGDLQGHLDARHRGVVERNGFAIAENQSPESRRGVHNTAVDKLGGER